MRNPSAPGYREEHKLNDFEPAHSSDRSQRLTASFQPLRFFLPHGRSALRRGLLLISAMFIVVIVVLLVPAITLHGKWRGSPSAAQAAGPEIAVWYGPLQPFGQRGMSQRWINILGKVTDPDGVKALTFALNGGPATPLSFKTDKRRLDENGDFNVEVDSAALGSGLHTITLVATDNKNNQSSVNVTLRYTAGQFWPLQYTADWSSAGSVQNVAQVVDGLWRIEGGNLRVVEPGYDRLVAIGDTQWRDYTVTVPVTINGLDPDPQAYEFPSNGPAVGVAINWQGHYGPGETSATNWPASQPRAGWWPLGALGIYAWNENTKGFRLRIVGNESVRIAEAPADRVLRRGVRYIFKLRVESNPSAPSTYRMKVWEDGKPEPQNWELQSNGPANELSQGSLLLLAHHVDASFGNVTVTPNNPGQAPLRGRTHMPLVRR
jgi:hypothetical protein